MTVWSFAFALNPFGKKFRRPTITLIERSARLLGKVYFREDITGFTIQVIHERERLLMSPHRPSLQPCSPPSPKVWHTSCQEGTRTLVVSGGGPKIKMAPFSIAPPPPGSIVLHG
jgi:hypothetical protein